MKRKEFIKATSASLLGAALLPTACAAIAPTQNSDRPLIKKSLKYWMIKEDLSMLDKFKLVKDLGFHGIEFDAPNDLDEKEILKARDKTGIELPGVVNAKHWDSPLSDPNPAVRKVCSDSMREAFQVTKRFGGTTVLLVPANVKKGISYQDAYQRSLDEIKALIPLAEKTGIKIAIENVWNNFLLSPMEAARFIDELNSEMVGWYFDVGNIIRYGWPEQWIEILGSRIIKIDIKDYSRKLASDKGVWKGFEAKIGDGDADWAAVNLALKKVGYQGWGSAEVSGGDRERLLEISERMDKVYAL